jgi:hypothetical protein
MINNTKKIAEIQLNKHRIEGPTSKLSVLEVAQLMDMIKTYDQMKQSGHAPSIFHSIAYN